MVFQHYHLFQNKRALENITEGLIVSQNMSKKEAEKVGEQFLSRIGLLHKKDAFPSELSGGQRLTDWNCPRSCDESCGAFV